MSAASQNMAIANAANGQLPAVQPAASAFGLAPMRAASPRLSTPAAPHAPITLPKGHEWHPIPPTAFKIPKEPRMKSSGPKVSKLSAAKSIKMPASVKYKQPPKPRVASTRLPKPTLTSSMLSKIK